MVIPPPQQDSQCPPVLDAEIATAVKSFPAGSAGGLDGLLPQILKDLLAPNLGEAASKLLAAIRDLANLVLREEVPTAIIPNLFGASLTALQKSQEEFGQLPWGSSGVVWWENSW